MIVRLVDFFLWCIQPDMVSGRGVGSGPGYLRRSLSFGDVEGFTAVIGTITECPGRLMFFTSMLLSQVRCRMDTWSSVISRPGIWLVSISAMTCTLIQPCLKILHTRKVFQASLDHTAVLRTSDFSSSRRYRPYPFFATGCARSYTSSSVSQPLRQAISSRQAIL